MLFSNIIGVFAVVAMVVAHPPVKKNGYSIVTHHDQPKKVPQSEWVKPSIKHAPQSSWNQGSYGKAASSFSTLSTASKHLPILHAPLKPLAWNPSASGRQYGQQHGNEKNTYPKYKFDYGVTDPHTGDNKKQWEARDGDVVKGAYQINDANGAKRVVEYSSNKHTGFQADVKSKIVKPHSKW